jgi:hypothetical protein
MSDQVEESGARLHHLSPPSINRYDRRAVAQLHRLRPLKAAHGAGINQCRAGRELVVGTLDTVFGLKYAGALP